MVSGKLLDVVFAVLAAAAADVVFAVGKLLVHFVEASHYHFELVEVIVALTVPVEILEDSETLFVVVVVVV